MDINDYYILHPEKIVLNNDNVPVYLERYLPKLKSSRRERSYYIGCIETWLHNFRRLKESDNLRTTTVQRKLEEIRKIAANFEPFSWPEVFTSIRRYEAFIKEFN